MIFANPSVTFNALADLRQYSSIFKYVRSADLQNVTISKSGIEGSLATVIDEIDIWKEKNVKVVFNGAPSFYLKATTDEVKVGAKNLDANVHFGTLLNNATAHLQSFQDDLYAWRIIGKNKLASTRTFLSDLAGSIDFADLQDPKINILTATIENLHPNFQNLNFKNGFNFKN